MPPQRTPLRPISGNIYRRKELTPYQRGQIVGYSLLSCSPTEISASLNIPESTVRDTLKKAPERHDGESSSRIGRPKLYSERDERQILRTVRLNPHLTYRQLQNQLPIKLSHDTIYRILKQNNITNWRAKKRPALTEEHAALRLAWAKEHKDWTEDQWSYMLWSDECSVERGKGKQQLWVFRTPDQKWDKSMIQPYNKGKDISIMIWSAFSGRWGRLNAYILERDFESKKNGYSANSYIACLQDNLPGVSEPGLKFMQDNASIHTAKKTRQWFEDNMIYVVEWPPYSPDMNPIEHLWRWLKEKLNELYPRLHELKGDEEVVREQIEEAIQHAWKEIPEAKLTALWKSMSRRCEAVIKAEGWYTKY